MLTITKPAPNRLDIELSGVLNADAMREGLDKLIAESADIRDGKMLYRIPDFEMPTMGALAIEFQQMPKLFGLLGKFDKCAVLSDSAWIRTAAEIEGAVIPSLEIRSFALAAEEAAEEWLADKSTDPDRDAENFPL